MPTQGPRNLLDEREEVLKRLEELGESYEDQAEYDELQSRLGAIERQLSELGWFEGVEEFSGKTEAVPNSGEPEAQKVETGFIEPEGEIAGEIFSGSAAGKAVKIEADTPSATAGIPSAQRDAEGERDLLNRGRLIECLYHLIVETGAEATPLTIGLFGDWGVGKSTVVTLLRKRLEPLITARKVRFATFNAWAYEHTENLVAGLAQETVRGITENLTWWERTRLEWKFAWKRHRNELRRILLTIGVATLVVLVSGIVTLAGQESLADQAVASAFLVGGIGAGGLFLFRLKKLLEHPIAADLQTYLKLPDYGEHLGLIPVLRADIEELCTIELGTRTEARGTLVVFIDDLDRCGPKGIVETLNAVRLVMDVENVFIIIAIDHRIALRAVASHYRDLGDTRRTPGDIARDYLGKIIQVPIRLLQPREVGAFIREGLFPTPRTEDAREPAGDFQAQRPVREETRTRMEETKDEVDEFERLATLFQMTNPRQLRRLRNCYQLLKGLYPRELAPLKWDELMLMLFWQEQLHLLPAEQHTALENAVISGNVKELVAQLPEELAYHVASLGQDEHQELASFVRSLILPRAT